MSGVKIKIQHKTCRIQLMQCLHRNTDSVLEKQDRSQTNNLSLHLKDLEREKQIKPKINVRK